MPKGKRIEPLDLEEIASSPSLNGLMDFRQATPIPSKPIGLTPIGLEVSSSKLVQAKASSTYELTPQRSSQTKEIRKHTKSTIPDSAPIDHRSVDLEAVLRQLAATPSPARSRGKVVPATKVEDGHSATQNAIYWCLWRRGQPVNGSRSHFVQAGYGQIQSALGMDRSNVQDAIRELQKKLALRVVKASTVGTATIYEVFSCESILEKRRAEGLLWAHRYGSRRVELLTNPDKDLLISAPIGTEPTGNKPTGLAPLDLGPGIHFMPIDPEGFTPIGGIGVTPIPLVSKVNRNKTSSNVVTLCSFVEQTLAPMDEDAAQKLLEACIARAGNQPVTVNDIIRVISMKSGAARKANNPIGFLLTAVPKSFPLRITEPEPKPAQHENPVEDFEYWERVSNDPNATDTLRETARRISASRP